MGADGSLLEAEEVTRGGEEPNGDLGGLTSPRLLLVLFDPGGVREIEIPADPSATLLVGRSSTADIVIEHASVSRQHARIRRGPGETVLVQDLGSSNGTFASEGGVGEELVPVVVGDSLRFGYVYARLAAPALRQEVSRVVTPTELDSRVAAEGERCLRHGGSIAVITAEVRPPGPTLAESIVTVLHHGDIVTLRRPGQCEALLIGRTKDQALEVADRVRDVLSGRDRNVRIGVAAFPGDAPSAGTLCAASLMAMRSAIDGSVRAARSAARVLRCEDQEIVAADVGTLRALGELERVAQLSNDVLLAGEPGTGKELFARLLHTLGPLTAMPFVMFDCRGTPAEQLVPGLFGPDGAVERAAGSTLYLQEVVALPVGVQDQLLEALTAGGEVRLVASSSDDLRTALREKRIRRPLHDRLSPSTIPLPPLRARRAEILLLAQRFIAQIARSSALRPVPLSGEAASALNRHSWPGNIDELREILVRALTSCDGELIRSTDLTVGAEDGLLTSARRLQDAVDEPTQQLQVPSDEELARYRTDPESGHS